MSLGVLSKWDGKVRHHFGSRLKYGRDHSSVLVSLALSLRNQKTFSLVRELERPDHFEEIEIEGEAEDS